MTAHSLEAREPSASTGVRLSVAMCLLGALIDYLSARGYVTPLLITYANPARELPDLAIFLLNPIVWRTLAAVVLWNTGRRYSWAAIVCALVPVLPYLIDTMGLFLLPLYIIVSTCGLAGALWLALDSSPGRARLALAGALFTIGEIL